jgi:Cu(I)/Ag(I) efflux system protein CusF
MRATTCALIGALTLSLAGVAAAQGIPDMSGMSMASAAKHGQGKGVIKAIDLKAGALTIQHGPIPAVGWPAMTMAFKAKPTQLLTGLKVGEAVSFDTTVRGMAADVTAVRPQ